MPLTDDQWEQIKQSIWNAERSNGNYTSYNERSGAGGAYQFMPETWTEKANLYGFADYANVPNASYAPPYVQDSVARGWASDLYDKYDGNIDFVLDAWLSGEYAADEDYARGYVSNTRSDGNITASDYVARASSPDGYTPVFPTANALDWSYITTNNPDQNVTNTERLRPEAIYGANTLGYYMYSNFEVPLMITGGAELGYHAKSASGHGHEDGWKIDVANDQIAGGTQAGADFKAFCNSQGWSCNWEDDHWDIDFSGTDSRDPQRGGFTGNFFGETFSSMQDAYGFDYLQTMMNAEHNEVQNLMLRASNDVLTPSFWEKLSTGFVDSFTDTGAFYVLQSLYGNIFHSSNHFGSYDKVTQADVDYVKAALPDDPATQSFILMNGRDSEEIKWLTTQKLEQQERRRKIEQYNDGCILTIANAGRLLGGLADPLNLVPVGAAFNGLKITARIGKMIYSTSKIAKVATKAATVGIVNVPVTITDDALREQFGGVQIGIKDYGWDAAMAFAGGAVLGGIGGVFNPKVLRSPHLKKIATTADHTETKGIRGAADLDNDAIRNETIKDALSLHDKNYGSTIKSKYYGKLENNKRVVAMKFDDAKALVARKAGIDIPDNAKSFYVPNEDYTILLTDRLKPTEVDIVLAHEYAVHAGLKNLFGEQDYVKLLDDVDKLSNKDGHIFNEARRLSNSYDPEEILAYAVEHDMLPKGFTSRIKGLVNRGLKREGLSSKITQEQVKDLLMQQAESQREVNSGFHFNDDGTTAFAGIKFSQDNPLNPQIWRAFYALEQPVMKTTQGMLPKFTRNIGKWFENNVIFRTPYGMMINSSSNTLRRFASQLTDDVRGRGLGNVRTISAETNKQRIIGQLSVPYLDYANVRQRWMIKNVKAPQAFDKLVIQAYNAKYAGNKANIAQEFPDEVNAAVEQLKRYRDLQLELGKRSATDVGSKSNNLIEEDWAPIDEELWRNVDGDMRQKFLAMFNTEDEAKEFLTNYYKSYAKRDVIRAKMERAIDKENKRIQEYNDSIPEGSERKPKPLLKKNIKDKDIDKWLDEHVPHAVDFIIKRNFDIEDKSNLGNIGNLNFFKERIPIDTTGVLKMPNGKEFSFDNNLRSYDLDTTIQKNMNRFAGELSVKNVFNNQDSLDKFLSKVQNELKLSVEDGRLNKGRADREYKETVNLINELRGIRPDRDINEQMGALVHIMRKLAYMKNGANMGFAQLGELGGAIAYGGISKVFSVFKPLNTLVENAKWGKITADEIRDVERQMFGASMESQIFSINYGDRALRDVLTEKDSIVNKALTTVGDVVSNASKITSAINMLPKMTDSMVRSMRTQTIMDSLAWANGEKVSLLRNPFSKAKLRASHISAKDAKRIQDNLKKYSTYQDGDLIKLDVEAFQKADPVSFAKWYGMIQTQSERAIISGSRLGNRNILKDKNLLNQLLFQFKDYSLRSINANTMRALTTRDLDDAIATMMSIVTNLGAYAVKAGATLAMMKAIGEDEKAQEYYDRMFSNNNLARAAIFRSAMIGSPISFFNDFMEAGRLNTGILDFSQGSVRTTVSHSSYGQADTVGEFAGNVIEQLPALQQAQSLFDIVSYFANEGNKKDFRNFLKAMPIPQWFPITTYLNKIVDDSSYPDRRPKD